MLATYKDLLVAQSRIKPFVVETPLLRPAILEEMFGVPIFLKCENLQHTGSFKFRGAYNKLSAITSGEKAQGVVAFSSGNHAQGVAKAAKMHAVKATIVMPEDSPLIKVNNTRGYGAEVITFNRVTQDRDDFVANVIKERGGVFVHPFNDNEIIAGQGTLGLEIIAQAGMQLDAILICCSGGGLSAGVALAFQEISPHTQIYVVEPSGFDDMTRSLKAGHVVKNLKMSGSICDGLLSPFPGDKTFPIIKSLVKGGFDVSDDEVKQAMRFAFQNFKLVIEPSGAVALATLLTGKFKPKGATAITISGGNVDAALYTQILGE